MIKKIKTLTNLINEAFVLVLRTNTKDEGIETAKAAIKGGCNIIEVTFTIPNADKVIEELIKDKNEEVVIGAGTVLDAETARIAILAGAEFIVSPSFDKETATLCNRYGIPYIPGCFTPREIKEARECGSDVIKLFPGSAFKPSIVKDLKAPIKGIAVMASGGVSFENMDEWFNNSCDIVSIGSAIIKLKDPAKIEAETRKYIERVKKLRMQRG
ncbi:TPA: bifunctional 2-keto-4-hydroxyglutarate aldolase/2-keto-3-deoxy-6-phosphogluconate aldolase [Clostridium perfringens]|uniref:bifunctional 2-keto-4-hydroxyglutarate aldolase/2-keto-3-deoxy-6-phosphogluconate aldolase n=1 Tax=Clostridium perfringens TaxID=1502 RepID=UPI000F5441E6|nr:bifunctional 2-keto-4-hydroxyglutarate aldolase/2-keto-3-deoxy-6-phosphogluconate aldolase [Clostridium perfringens]EJT6341043.1 bifunctional 2-keto-4-hydroxyglutarate aldolase/2-keto-3-deoxy-6-phosphogluconate aldolase [Clostridium perfringens]ELC8426448.1 bifunctional 2-keto-4-hydroxyglutarate aldolase/2-keto-3-deoxy-6-phosphogluconate aldolase [Clostridium perfringens]ELQ0172342.1 bifunctional 2-keto-4-hydroxyglutarate aldolase/2-keto-3-deoxy-6-phosphogluconate aldolase [Clostridium perfri